MQKPFMAVTGKPRVLLLRYHPSFEPESLTGLMLMEITRLAGQHQRIIVLAFSTWVLETKLITQQLKYHPTFKKVVSLVLIVLYYICLCVDMCMPWAHLWRSEDNLQKCVLSFHHVGPSDKDQQAWQHLPAKLPQQPKKLIFFFKLNVRVKWPQER